MEKKWSSIIIDKFFLIIVVFVLSLIWIRYYVHNTFLIYLYTTIATVVICSIFHIFFKKKQKKYDFNKKERQNIENLTNLFTFQTKQATLKYFINAIKNKNIDVIKDGNFLLFNNNILTVNYSLTCVSQNEIIDTVVKAKTKKLKQKNLIICGAKFCDEAKKLTAKVIDYKILLLDEKDVYIKLFKPLNLSIEKPVVKKTKKQKFLNMLNTAFNRARFKGYLISALILLIGSYFLRYNLYYLISSTILMIFAVFSYFNTVFNKKTINVFENSDNLDKKNLP